MIFDISCNISDPAYNSKTQNTRHLILKRAFDHRIIPFFVGSDFQTSKLSLELAIKYNTYCYVGLHPNSATKHKNELPDIIKLLKSKNNCNSGELKFFSKIKSPIIAVGECGLDFYRESSSVEDQKYVFKELLDLNEKRYFIHSRNAHREVMDILSDYKIKAVIHSFDGNVEQAQEIIKRGYFLSLNGHSLKNYDFLNEIDMNRIMIESDAPYCKISTTNNAYKYVKTFFREVKKTPEEGIRKGRNEPLHTIQVLEAVSDILNIPILEMEKILEKNTYDFYDL